MTTVIVYSTPVCPWCDRIKEFLKENKVEFKEIDVTQSREKAMELMQKSGQMAVPVLDIDGEIIIGFDEARIKKVLKL